jgi:hypothetical protein
MSGSAVLRGFPRSVLRVLVFVFVFAAAGSLALVIVDFLVDRPAGGDIFIAVINSFVATVLCWGLAKRGQPL